MAITALPAAPSRNDPTNFASEADAFLNALPTFATEANALASAVNADKTSADASASDAAAQVTLAAAQVTLAAAQVTLANTAKTGAENAQAAAENAANAVAWVSGTTYVTGDTVWSPATLQTFRRVSGGGGVTDPSADPINWAVLGGALPTQTGNSGKFLRTSGLNPEWASSGISNVVTATGMTTLTSTPTLLQITPAAYGVAVTLPDATTCAEGGPIHIIDNRGAYPVRVLNSAGTLLGFVFAGVVSHVSLADNSAAAGVWSVENSELVGAAAQLLTTNITNIKACVDLGSGKECVVSTGASNNDIYSVVYDKTSNTFGSVTLVRTATSAGIYHTACLSGANQVLVVSCSSTTALEAVTLSISGTTITVNTAATATLSANLSAFTDGCGLIAVGSSFVTSYTVATPAAQIRALSISGTTVTIGSASVLDGTAGGLIADGGSSKVIAVSTATTHLYTKPYTVSGSGLSAGTGTDTNSGTMDIQISYGGKLFPLGSRWCALYLDGTTNMGAVISLSGTTTTITVVSMGLTGSYGKDAIVVGSSKVLVTGDATSINANILTDSAGTASAGTAITLGSAAARACLYVSGTDVAVQEGTTTYRAYIVDCSGASPVLTKTITTGGSSVEAAAFTASNSVLSRAPRAVYGTAYARNVFMSSATQNFDGEVRSGVFRRAVHNNVPGDNTSPGASYRGKADSERWIADGSTVITKVECVS